MFLFKEGDECNDIYIIRSGQYMISKNQYISKLPENSEKNMLINNTCIIKRYQNNFKNLQGFKNDFNIKLLEIGVGHMIGEDSIFKNKACSMSVKCVTPEGQLWVIKRQDFKDL